jgi:hypothetical protein
MTYRKLRIAWSVGWGIVAVLLCVLWVRSFTWSDRIWGRFSDLTGFVLSSYEGRIQLYVERFAGIFPWRIDYAEPIERTVPPHYFPTLEFPLSTYGSFWAVPYWLLFPVFSTLALAPWFCRRFSLHSLLIATTLVAVVLGLVSWLSSP